jgi:uncharacterized SAM-binding protein YcdF (DUF218 family)
MKYACASPGGPSACENRSLERRHGSICTSIRYYSADRHNAACFPGGRQPLPNGRCAHRPPAANSRLGARGVTGVPRPQPAPQVSDAIVVISGDEQLARFQEGVTLYQNGFGRYLVFSGAAYDNGTSNADVMRALAVKRGVPVSAILDEPQGEDTWGNAIFTRQVLEDHGLHSAILVTSPYHSRRAKLTFDTAYAGSGIRLMVHAAPDSQWRKLSWWQQPETRRLTFTELQKLGYIFATGQYH